MIHVNRSTVATPVVLDLSEPESLASRELKKARQHFAIVKSTETFPFKVYKHQAVKNALTELFHGKCAYCESVYANVLPMDIEHYRPKGGYLLEGKLKQPGYWWLAADWDNLLPSCIDCNRKRNHQNLEGETEAMGKGSAFPIDDEDQRADAEGLEAGEVRLLLDPCRDQPDELLSFSETGEVKARDDVDDLGRRIVKQSTKAYGLNRFELASIREELALEVGRLISSLSRAPIALKHSQSAANRTELADLLRQLLDKRRDQSAHSGLVRQHTARLEPAIERFVDHHFGDQLPSGEGRILERFVAAFATPRRPLADSIQATIDAFAA